MSLEKREDRFSELCSRFDAYRPGKLIAYHLINEKVFNSLKISLMQYISKSISKDYTIFDEQEILESIDKIPNMTPNGKILPKPFSVLEYNILLKTACDLLKNLNIADLSKFFYVPVIRYKPAIPVNNNRNY